MKVHYPFLVKHTTVHPEVDIAWCDEGEGEQTLLFIHGLAGYLPLWKYQIQGLKAKYRCIALDLPGNGKSTSGNVPYSMFFYAETVAKFIEKENLRNVILCGHSMGGHVSLVLALRYPNLIEKLVLVAPSGLENFATHEVMGMLHFMDIGQMFYANSSHIDSTIKQSFYKENSESNNIISDLKKLIKEHSFKKWNAMITILIKSMLNEQVGQFLPTLSLDTLIIFGEKDEFIPNRLIHPLETTKSIAESGKARIKNSRYVLIPKAGHFVHIEKFAEVNTLIDEFIGK